MSALTKREQTREELRENPPDIKVGDTVNVDGIGTDMEVIQVTLGAQGWYALVRNELRETWRVDIGRCWQGSA